MLANETRLRKEASALIYLGAISSATRGFPSRAYEGCDPDTLTFRDEWSCIPP